MTRVTSPQTETWHALVAQLAAARKQQGFSQRGLGARLGMAEIVVGKWENHADLPSASSFMRWTHALDHSVQIRSRRGRPVAQQPTPHHHEPFEDYEIRRLAATLKQARIDARHTQQTVGELVDVSEWTIRMWETMRRPPRIMHLIQWADVLSCAVVLRPGASSPGVGPQRANDLRH